MGLVRSLLALLLAVLAVAPAGAIPRWLGLPPTPTLPLATQQGYVSIADGARIWYAEFGTGQPVLLVHGGLANADYWGLQVRALASHYRVIVMDSRCHGRSSCGSTPLGYDRMAADVLVLLDRLHVPRVALIGWSDGAIIGLDLAIHHPQRLVKLFAFAANSDPSGVADPGTNPVATAYLARTPREYARLSPTPHGYAAFASAVTRMWATQPHFSVQQLHGIRVPTWIVDADHDEFIKRANTDYMARTIGQGELLLPEVSHFAFLQAPALFDAAVLQFLQG